MSSVETRPATTSGVIQDSNFLSTWKTFLSDVATFTGDLTSFAVPSFFLMPLSLLEFTAYWGDHPELLISPSKENDPADRFLGVLKWFLATMKIQYCSRKSTYGFEKKPYNPVLGELFYAHWPSDECKEDDTVIISEQVSHHPPVSAFRIKNEKFGIECTGQNEPIPHFKNGYLELEQKGHTTFKLTQLDETYSISYPKVTVGGLWYAAPYLELAGDSYILSTSGYWAKLSFISRGYFSVQKDQIKINVMDRNDNVLFEITGQWSGTLFIKHIGESGKSKTFLKNTENFRKSAHVKDINDQTPLESRRLWENVTKALMENNFGAASKEKSIIEEKQRQLRREEEETEMEWTPRHFKFSEQDEQFTKMMQKIGLVPSDGLWEFVPESFESCA